MKLQSVIRGAPMALMLAHPAAMVCLLFVGILLGGYFAWKLSRSSAEIQTLAELADRGDIHFTGAWVGHAAGTLLALAVAYWWLPGALAAGLFGLGREQVGNAPREIVGFASFFPMVTGSLIRWRADRASRALHAVACPAAGG